VIFFQLKIQTNDKFRGVAKIFLPVEGLGNVMGLQRVENFSKISAIHRTMPATGAKIWKFSIKITKY
jgi:hypothetical protein